MSESVDDGRYVYCIVDREGGAPAPDEPTLETEGVDGEPVSLVAADGSYGPGDATDLAAVVHECDGVYDATDERTVRCWLLAHQSVVDAAGEAFGTPLPFRFDTVVRGDDARVATWMHDNGARLRDALDRVAGAWEYRIEVRWDETRLADRVAADDDELAALADRRAGASEGTAFLLDKQYERALSAATADHRSSVMAALRADLDAQARAITTVEQSVSSLEAAGESADETVSESLTVLAAPEHEEAIGDRLDEVAARPGVTVRYTGPWPPYSFTPSFEEDQ
ncbi:gas vesicle protein GvpL [Haloarchaeobius amylolyticus]|uniref:gas vesicle protein GvpL n=1 Tax=Haloarchaeobius amylolyticus TaxID=1198296 RepID=UPI002270D832